MKQWSQEEIEKVSKIPNNIYTKEEIAKIVGRSYISIKKKAKDKGITIKPKKHHHKAWSKEELETLNLNYKCSKKKTLDSLPNRSWTAICGMAKRIGLNRGIKNRWTDYEIEFMKLNYYDTPMEKLCHFIPNRSWEQIKMKASKMKLKRSLVFYRKTNLSVLLEDTHLTYYWMGFLMADGCFHNNRLKFCLANKDADYVMLFAKYIEAGNNIQIFHNRTEVSAKNIDIIPQICKKFDIHERKTYNPPSNLPTVFALDFIIGLIDGDGNISNHQTCNSFRITLKMHKSWLYILQEIESILYGNSKNFRAKIDATGYASVHISDSEACKRLKQYAIDSCLPIMSRKWDIIDLSQQIIKRNKLNSICAGQASPQ